MALPCLASLAGRDPLSILVIKNWKKKHCVITTLALIKDDFLAAIGEFVKSWCAPDLWLKGNTYVFEHLECSLPEGLRSSKAECTPAEGF